MTQRLRQRGNFLRSFWPMKTDLSCSIACGRDRALFPITSCTTGPLMKTAPVTGGCCTALAFSIALTQANHSTQYDLD